MLIFCLFGMGRSNHSKAMFQPLKCIWDTGFYTYINVLMVVAPVSEKWVSSINDY